MARKRGNRPFELDFSDYASYRDLRELFQNTLFSNGFIYHQDHMKPLVKRVLTLLALLTVLSTVVVGIRYELRRHEQHEQKKREAAYASALHFYTQEFKIGMTRKEVEEYFRTKNTKFMQMCCVDFSGSRASLDDLTRIGQEDAPWYCSENNVYVAFHFSEYESHSGMPRANDLDTLKTVTIYRWLEGCL